MGLGAMLGGLAALLVACAKLNPSYQLAGGTGSADATTRGDPTSPTTSATSSSTSTSSTTPDPETTGPDDGRGSESAESTSGGPSKGSSGETSDPFRPWSDDCRTELVDVPCPGPVSVAGDLTCVIGPFAADGDNDCDRLNAVSTDVEFEPGIFVLGVAYPFDAQLLLEYRGNPTCEPGVSGVATDEPLTAALSLRTEETEPALLIVRDATGLCPVPDNCCEPSKDGAAAACDDPGLAGCVVDFDAYCEEVMWDIFCVRTAVLLCGADCDQVL